MFIFLLVQLISSFTFPYMRSTTSPLAFSLCFLWDADCHLCCLLYPESPTCLLSTLCRPRLVQGFHPLLFPWSLSLTVAPSGLCLLFQFIFSALISCLSSQMYLSKQSLSAFPSVLGGGKATLGKPFWSGDFSILLYRGMSTCGMGISHRHLVKGALKHSGSCDTACLAFIKS